jgi:hypothetical protein
MIIVGYAETCSGTSTQGMLLYLTETYSDNKEVKYDAETFTEKPVLGSYEIRKTTAVSFILILLI